MMLYDIINKRIKTKKYEPSAIDVRVLSEFDNNIRKIKHILGASFDYNFQVSSVWKKESHSLILSFSDGLTKENLINAGYVLSEFELYLQAHNIVGNLVEKKHMNNVELAFGQTLEFSISSNNQFVSYDELFKNSLSYDKSIKATVISTDNTIKLSISKKRIEPKNDKFVNMLIKLGIYTKYIELYLQYLRKNIKNISLVSNDNDTILIEFE
jgi:5'-3' exonuclease